jgi:phosphate transport system substrate-binding protein
MNTCRFLSILVLGFGLVAPATAERLVIKGSNTFGEELGPRLIEDFKKTHAEWEIELESRSTGHGIQALLDGACDIAPASRSLNDDEIRLAKSRGLTLRVHTIGYYGIAVIVHRDNPVGSLADHQVRDIFTGALKNWSSVRGPDAPIVTHISVPEAGTYLGFQELAMDRRPYRADAVAHESYADIAAAVAKDPNAIGYVAMSLAAGPSVRAVKINGVPATPISVSDDQYPYARLLRFYTDKNRESLAAREFIRYVRSRQGQNVLEDAGFVRRFQRHLSFGMETQ